MELVFEKEYLRELYETRKTSNKKYRFQKDIIKRYQRKIEILVYAESVESLYPINSLNYEVLKGDKAGISSIRVNDQYRIEFTVEQKGDKRIVTVCNILELSNHYK